LSAECASERILKIGQ